MAEFEQAGATERLRRIAILRDMQRRLRFSPAEALGVAPTASAAEVRSAFMSLTKQYHPTKFARLDEPTMKLANEVFLQLREAYETLKASAEQKKPDRRPTNPVEGSPHRLATNNEATATAKLAAGAAGQPPLNSNAPTRPSTSAMTASARQSPSPGGSPSTTHRPGIASPPSSASAGGAVAGRPAGPVSASISGAAAAGGRGAIPSAAKPPEISKEMAKVRDLITCERWAEARDALQILLVHRPSDRANLAQLAYVRGREALELGNVTEARRELVRALAIEPTMEHAKAALQTISTPSLRR